MFIDPIKTLSACHIKTTDTVAEFGAGSGHLVRALARIVSKGTVFAIEINKDLVARMTRELSDNAVQHVHVFWGDIEVPEGTKIKDSSIDVVVLSNVLFQLDDKQGCIKEAARVLKPEGKIVVIDWNDSHNGMGPAPHHVFSQQSAIELLGRQGYTSYSILPSSTHHYAILFTH